MADTDLIIGRTQQWIEHLVIGYKLCPFAEQPFKSKTIEYVVTDTTDLELALATVASSAFDLGNNDAFETSLLIFSQGFLNFDAFLDLIALADQLLVDLIVSDDLLLAHFHPDYCFAGAQQDDAANYSNRSVYPMLHFLKQGSVSAASNSAINLHAIPERNKKALRGIGAASLSSSLAALRNNP